MYFSFARMSRVTALNWTVGHAGALGMCVWIKYGRVQQADEITDRHVYTNLGINASPKAVLVPVIVPVKEHRRWW